MSTRSKVRVLFAVASVVVVAACTPSLPPTASYPVQYPPIASTPVGGVETVWQVLCNNGLPPAPPEGPFVDVRTTHHTRVTLAIDGVPWGVVTTFPDPLHSPGYERTPSPRVLPGSCLSILVEDFTSQGPFTALLAWHTIIV